MSITINGQEPSVFGIINDGIILSTRALGMSVLTLQVTAQKYDSDLPFQHGDSLTLELDNQRVFKGTVELVPRSMRSESEGWRYMVHDAWEHLDNLIFQERRNYLSGTVEMEGDQDPELNTVEQWIAHVIFQAEETLGDRIRRVLEYAITAGVDIQIGDISPGIQWYRSEYKAQTCGQMLRDMMRLMEDHTCWIDHTQDTPTFNMRPSAALPVITYDVTAGSPNVLHEITELETQNVPGVVLQYERPVTIDSRNQTEITYDIAPADLDVTQIGVLIEPIPVEGSNVQSEYAPITTETIPQSDAEADDIKEWWINQTPELANIAHTHGVEALRDILNIPQFSVPADNVVAHNITVVDDGIERPEPINPNSTPVTQTLDPQDYPRYIIEGSLPEWAGRRFRRVRATSTLAVRVDVIEAIINDELRTQMMEIFNLPKTYEDTDYLTANFAGEVTGTNARTRTYPRTVTFDLGEEIPIGIAQDLLTQLNLRRYSGSFATVAQESDIIARIGHRIQFTGSDRPEWDAMSEIIQEVTYDFTKGRTSITFGPPELLGATDLIERRRATRRNTYSYGFSSDNDITEGVGGAVASPVFNFSRVSGGGGGGSSSPNHPWRVTLALNEDTGIYTASITNGRIYTGLSSIETASFSSDLDEVVDGDIIHLELDYETNEVITIKVINRDAYERVDLDNGIAILSRYPLAEINLPANATALTVTQIARNNLALAGGCFDGINAVRTFTPV